MESSRINPAFRRVFSESPKGFGLGLNVLTFDGSNSGIAVDIYTTSANNIKRKQSSSHDRLIYWYKDTGDHATFMAVGVSL